MAELTYEQLFDILRREKSRDELQTLDARFYEQVRLFLLSKQDIIQAESVRGIASLASQRATIEYQNIRKLLKELYERRERKIVTLALHKARTDATIIDIATLLQKERSLFSSLVQLLQQHRDDVFLNYQQPSAVTPMTATIDATSYDQDTPELASESSAKAYNGDNESVELADTSVVQEMTVRFTAPVPKFVGKDLRVFGPFTQGDQATLPWDVAEILVRKARAHQIE